MNESTVWKPQVCISKMEQTCAQQLEQRTKEKYVRQKEPAGKAPNAKRHQQRNGGEDIGHGLEPEAMDTPKQDCQ